MVKLTRRTFLSGTCATALWNPPSLVQASEEKQRKPSLSNPTPEVASEIAAYAVKLVREIEGVVLDYSPKSLAHIDKTVLSFRDSGKTVRDVNGTLVVFGCYVGEVLVRNLGARWEMPGSQERKLGFDIVGIRTPSGVFWNPIGKVFKLLLNGEEDSVQYLYSVVKAKTS